MRWMCKEKLLDRKNNEELMEMRGLKESSSAAIFTEF